MSAQRQLESPSREIKLVKSAERSRMSAQERRDEAERITRELETLKRRVAKLAE